MTAALSALTTFLYKYRGRVRDEVGAEREQELYMGLEKTKYHLTNIDSEGNVTNKDIEEAELKGPIEGLSPYAFVYGPYWEDGTRNYEWEDNMDYNVNRLREIEKDFTNKLRASDREIIDKKTGRKKIIPGSVMLNDILEVIGHPPTEAGCYVGWIHRKGSKNEIDLGLGLNTIERYWNGDRVIFLDPNVDGVVCDLIDKGIEAI